MIDALKAEFQGNVDDLISMSDVDVRVVDQIGAYTECKASVKYDQIDQEDERYVLSTMMCAVSKTDISEVKNSFKIRVKNNDGEWIEWDVREFAETEVGFQIACSQNVGVKY